MGIALHSCTAGRLEALPWELSAGLCKLLAWELSAWDLSAWELSAALCLPWELLAWDLSSGGRQSLAGGRGAHFTLDQYVKLPAALYVGFATFAAVPASCLNEHVPVPDRVEHCRSIAQSLARGSQAWETIGLEAAVAEILLVPYISLNEGKSLATQNPTMSTRFADSLTFRAGCSCRTVTSASSSVIELPLSSKRLVASFFLIAGPLSSRCDLILKILVRAVDEPIHDIPEVAVIAIA